MVGDEQLGVDLEGGAEAVARLARSVGRVEREVARRRLVVAGAALRARQVLAEGERLALHGISASSVLGGEQLDLGDAVGQLQRRFQRVGEPPLDAVAPHQPVDDDLDAVLLVARQLLVALEELGDVDDLAVDARPHEALPGQVVEQGAVLALAAAHDGRQQIEPFPGRTATAGSRRPR